MHTILVKPRNYYCSHAAAALINSYSKSRYPVDYRKD